MSIRMFVFVLINAQSMITRDEVLMGRDKKYPLSTELEANLTKLLAALNKFRTKYGKVMFVSSGYRPPEFNKAAGGSKKSAHLSCLACDFKDLDGSLDKWCSENQDFLAELGLWQENPKNTPNWCHLDLVNRP